MSSNPSKSASLAELLIAGIKKHLSTATSVTFGGATYTPAQIETSLQTLADLRSAVDAAKATTQAKVAAEKTQAPPLRSLMAAFEAYVKVTFGNAPDVLADFGLTPNKARTPLTVEQKAEAAAKRAATRAARHTMGKVQKKAVKGTITTIVTQPPPTAPASVVTGTPAVTPVAAPPATAPKTV
jgi:hypothetical protein